jgi:hypothetical protein
MMLYHGGLEPIEKPFIRKVHSSRTTDFGYGFYTTTDYEQAKQWVDTRRTHNQTAKGYVSVFSADDGLLKIPGLNNLVFKHADESWLDFVYKNRTESGFSHSYDIVAGPVANDRVYASLSLFEDGLLDKAETIKRLKAYVLVNQLLFHTDKALSYISFVRVVEE